MMELKAESDPKGKFRRASNRMRRHLPPHLPPLFLLTDPNRTPDPIALAAALPMGSGIIYRHFSAPDREQIAASLALIAKRRSLCFLIGNDPELARHVKADGVHWPEGEMCQCRKWRNVFFIMTAAAHGRQALSRANALPIDASLVSTVFPSNSPSASDPIGALKLRQLKRTSSKPVYALGGVDARNVGSIAEFAGAASIAGAADAFQSQLFETARAPTRNVRD